MRAISHTSTPTPTITRASARPAGVARVRVARRRLQLGERTAPLAREIALVHRVIDEIPGQDFVDVVAPMHPDVGVRETVATVPAQRTENGPPVGRVALEPLEQRSDPA